MDTDAFTDVDPSQPVFPIRGSFVKYSCEQVNRGSTGFMGHAGINVGKNCAAYDSPNASGICYKTTYGEWHCTMMDPSASSVGRQRIAPPR